MPVLARGLSQEDLDAEIADDGDSPDRVIHEEEGRFVGTVAVWIPSAPLRIGRVPPRLDASQVFTWRVWGTAQDA
jgi:hypothetical protein